MAIESSGHSPGNPRMYELFENAPKTGPSPTIWAWPQFVDFLKVAGQPVQGPWPPHQSPRPDPEAETLPVAIPDPQSVRPVAGPIPALAPPGTGVVAPPAAATPTNWVADSEEPPVAPGPDALTPQTTPERED
jgi:hypothetical protein